MLFIKNTKRTVNTKSNTQKYDIGCIYDRALKMV